MGMAREEPKVQDQVTKFFAYMVSEISTAAVWHFYAECLFHSNLKAEAYEAALKEFRGHQADMDKCEFKEEFEKILVPIHTCMLMLLELVQPQKLGALNMVVRSFAKKIETKGSQFKDEIEGVSK